MKYERNNSDENIHFAEMFVVGHFKARQILFIEHKFYTTAVDPKCFTLKITEFKRERKRQKQKTKPVLKTIVKPTSKCICMIALNEVTVMG